MTKHYIYIIIILALVLAIGLGYLSYRRIDAKAQRLQGQYDSSKAQIIEEKEKAEEKILEAKKRIVEKNKEITDKNMEIIALKEKGDVKDGQIDELEQEFNKLEGSTEKIVNLQKQVEAWKEKFYIGQDVILAKDDIIFSLQRKYKAQLEISKEYQDMYLREFNLRKLCEERLMLCGKKTSRLRLGTTIKTVIIAGLIGYKLIKGA